MVKNWKRTHRAATVLAKKPKADASGQEISPLGNSSSLPESTTQIPQTDACLEKPAERLKKLREAVDKGGVQANANFLAYLAILIYFFVAVTSTTHEDLLRETPKAVPLLNIQLPLWWFFFVGPMALTLIHLNLLSQYFYLTQNVLRFDAYISKLQGYKEVDASLAKEERNIPLNFSLSNLILDKEMPKALRIIMRILLWLFVVCAPVALLLLFQGYFIPYHDPLVTWSQRALLLGDVFMLLLLWQFIASAQKIYFGNTNNITVSISPWRVIKMLPGTSLLMGFCALVSLFILTIPGEALDKYRLKFLNSIDSDIEFKAALNIPKNIREGILVGLRKPFQQNLNLSGKLLLKNEPSPELLSKYAGNLENHDIFFETLVKKYSLGINVNGRDLKGANFIDSKLICAQLNGANLDGADFSRANLKGASFNLAHSKDAKFENAILDDASLLAAHIEYANFRYASLKKTILSSSYMQCSIFEKSNLDDASIIFAKAQGANFVEAQLRGARLTGAEMQGVNLSYALLHGADMTNVKMQGAILGSTEMQCADLRGSIFQGADITGSSFQGANLSEVKFFGVLANNVDFRGAYLNNALIYYCDFENADISNLNDSEWSELYQNIYQSLPILNTELSISKFQNLKKQVSDYDIKRLIAHNSFANSAQAPLLVNNSNIDKLAIHNKYAEYWGKALNKAVCDYPVSAKGIINNLHLLAIFSRPMKNEESGCIRAFLNGECQIGERITQDELKALISAVAINLK